MISRRHFAALAAGAAFAAGLPGRAGRAAAPPLIAFAQDHMANDWRAAQVAAVARTLAQAGPEVTFVHTDARGSAAQQVLDIDGLVARGVKVLISSPPDPAVVTPAIERAHAAGVRVVLLTRRSLGEGFDAFIGPDDEAIAADAATLLARLLGGKGRILVIQGLPGASTTQGRTRGFAARLADHPGLELAGVIPGAFLRAGGLRAIEQALAEGIAFDAVFAHSDSMAVGARMALRKAGIDPASLPIVGIDYIPEAREAIRAGEQAASFTYPTCGAEGAAAALALLRDEPVPRHTTVPSVLVTRETVDVVDTIF